jgi:hypothetical protein
MRQWEIRRHGVNTFLTRWKWVRVAAVKVLLAYSVMKLCEHTLLPYSALIYCRCALREFLRSKAAHDNIIYRYKFVEDFMKVYIKLSNLLTMVPKIVIWDTSFTTHRTVSP